MKQFLVLFSGTALLMLISSGCAFVDDKVSLAYNQGVGGVNSAQGGEILIEKPSSPELKKKDNGMFVVGNVKNTYGMKTADTVTKDSVPDWIASAMSLELKTAGYSPQVVEDISSSKGNGIKTRILKIWVEPDMGFWTVGAVAEVQMRIALYHDGERVKEFDIESKGQPARAAIELSFAEKKRDALRIALESCMKKALPIIVETYSQE